MNSLFAGISLTDHLTQRKHRMLRELDQADGDNLFVHVPETLAEAVAERYCVMPIALGDAAKRVDISETRLDARYLPDRVIFDESRPVWVDGTQATLSLPFTGTQELLTLRPGTWDSCPPQGRVVGSDLVFVRSWPDTPTPGEVEAWVNQAIADVKTYVSWQQPDVRSHNESLVAAALDVIGRRRESLLSKRGLQSALPFNMTARPDAPLTFAPEGVRRKAAFAPPKSAGHQPFQPEASLSPEQFEDILRTLRAIGRSMERTSGTFTKLEEEELRSVFLAALNAQFEGGASGETFNASGKTDILIRHADRNLFIGECKVWKGPSGLSDAIDQVLGYLCWRDSHAAVLLFVRNKDMSAVVDKIPDTVASHENHVRQLKIVSDSEWHYKFMQKDDSARELTLAIHAYHLRS